MSDKTGDIGAVIGMICFALTAAALCFYIGAGHGVREVFESIEQTGSYTFRGNRRIIGKIEYRVDGWQAERPTETGDRK